MPGFCRFKLDTEIKRRVLDRFLLFRSVTLIMKVLLGRKIKRFPQVLFYTFSGLRDTNLRKSSTWSFLKFFRLSKIEKRRVSPILGSLNFYSKGPVQLQTGTNHSFLGFESKLGWTHPKDELIIKHMLSSSSLLKIKRYLPEMVGEKREE